MSILFRLPSARLNASEGWRSLILGCLILGMLPLSGRDQSR